MSSLSSSSLPSGKTLRGPELSDIFVKKPRILARSCPVETTAQRLPVIEDNPPPRKKKEVKKGREPSEENWLKHGISLPKLQTKEAPPSCPFRREEVSEALKAPRDEPINRSRDNTLGSDVHQSSDVLKPLRYLKNSPKAATEKEADPSETVEVVGPSACDLDFRVPSADLNLDECEEKSEPPEESHALKRWKHWLREHKLQQNYLSRTLNRRKCDLQFQRTQNYRMVVEDKELFTGAQLPVADKWRGHPYRWKSHLKLGGSENSFGELSPEYFAVKTKLEKGELPDMQFIGIPTSIRREKSLICEDVSKTRPTHWLNLNFHFRSKQLLEQTKILKPHDVKMDDLEIIGRKIPEEAKEEVSVPHWPEKVPEIVVHPPESENSCSLDFYGGEARVFWLSIGGEDLQYEIGVEYCQKIRKKKFELTWEIDFGVAPVGVVVERTLRVENKGTTAVEYKFCSQKSEKTQSLDRLQPIKHEPWLFFNKNPGIFLPGQIYHLTFYHQAKRSGVRKETWHLQTQPPLTKNEETGTLIFRAVCTEDSSDSGIKDMDSYLQRQATRSAVAFILQVLLTKALNPSENLRGIEYRSLFLEEELFEYQNPKHFHHSAVVKQLRRLFEQIPQCHQPEWDFSLTSLTELTKKHLTGKQQDSFLREIAENAKKLFRPNRLAVRKMKKHRMCYEILCKMVSFMEEDHEYLKSCFTERREGVKRISWGLMEAEDEGSELSSGGNMAAEGFVPEIVFEIRPINFLYFRTMFYMRVYDRVREAVESVAGAIETSKLLEPWKATDYNPAKPSRGSRE